MRPKAQCFEWLEVIAPLVWNSSRSEKVFDASLQLLLKRRITCFDQPQNGTA